MARIKGDLHGYESPTWPPPHRRRAGHPSGVVLPAFDNVDVYPLLMRLLGLEPLSSDGTIAPLLPALL